MKTRKIKLMVFAATVCAVFGMFIPVLLAGPSELGSAQGYIPEKPVNDAELPEPQDTKPGIIFLQPSSKPKPVEVILPSPATIVFDGVNGKPVVVTTTVIVVNPVNNSFTPKGRPDLVIISPPLVPPANGKGDPEYPPLKIGKKEVIMNLGGNPVMAIGPGNPVTIIGAGGEPIDLSPPKKK